MRAVISSALIGLALAGCTNTQLGFPAPLVDVRDNHITYGFIMGDARTETPKERSLAEEGIAYHCRGGFEIESRRSTLNRETWTGDGWWWVVYEAKCKKA